MKDNIRALYLIDCLTAKAGDRTYPYGKYTYYASLILFIPQSENTTIENAILVKKHIRQLSNY